MKLPSLTLAAAFISSASAFAPSPPRGGIAAVGRAPPAPPLRSAVSGEDVRQARAKFAPGIFETHGSRSSAGRAQVSGEDVRRARAKLAPGIFETHGSGSSAGRAQVSGEDVREGRDSYAPFDRRGRAGRVGEVGTTATNDDDDGPGGRRTYVPASGMYVQPRVSPEFAPSFESSSPPPPSSYGLGGGTKKRMVAGTSTGAASGYLGNL